MNFDFMPELRWRLGYPLVLAVIIGLCLTLYVKFKTSQMALGLIPDPGIGR